MNSQSKRQNVVFRRGSLSLAPEPGAPITRSSERDCENCRFLLFKGRQQKTPNLTFLAQPPPIYVIIHD